MTAPRILGAMRAYNDFVEIVRARIAELGITYAVADDLAGLQDGYIAKLLCSPPIRRMTPWVLFMVCTGLGMSTLVVEDQELLARIKARVDRGRRRAQKRIPAAASIIEITPDLMRQLAIKGAKARNEKLTPQQRSKLARRAVRARWRKARLAVEASV